MKPLSEGQSKKILGVAGRNTIDGQIRADEFLQTLRGKRAIKKYQEMRDNDSTIGAVMYATEQVLRDVKLSVKAANDTPEAQREKEFVESVLEDMEHTLDDHVSEAISFLSYGFSFFEVVYKRRIGPYVNNPKKRSKYTDGRLGVRKLASRAPWTISRFDVEESTGDILGLYQDVGFTFGEHYIPMSKGILYRTTTVNGDASGRSVLRNAYTSYERLNTLQQYEAIGIERELAGIPVIEVPADYLSPDATDEQVALRNQLEQIGRDLKFNDQAYILLPSDTYPGKEGEPTNVKMINFRLVSSEGKRAIDIDPVIRRYQHDIARSVLSEFIMLGNGEHGSYALSKSKTDLFLRALESYIQTIVDVLNKQLIEPLWYLNGLDFDLMPKIVAGDIAPHDLKELGSYLRNLNGANINLADQTHIVDALLENAELPLLDQDVYAVSRERDRLVETARADYYDGPDDNVVGSTPDDDKEDEIE